MYGTFITFIVPQNHTGKWQRCVIHPSSEPELHTFTDKQSNQKLQPFNVFWTNKITCSLPKIWLTSLPISQYTATKTLEEK